MRSLCGGFAGTRGIDGSGLKSLQGASERSIRDGHQQGEMNAKASKAQTNVIQLVS